MIRPTSIVSILVLAVLLAACDTGAPVATPTLAATQPTPVETATAPAPDATAPPSPTVAPSLVRASPTADLAALAAYATLTALAQAAAVTATAAAAPTATATPPPPAAPVPAGDLATYGLILTARAEDNRIYRQTGTLVLSPARPGSGHSAELQLWYGVRAGHEHADLSPGSTVGALYLATSAALLPAGFDRAAPYQVGVLYDPATKLLTVDADPAQGIPGGWSLGPKNPTRSARPITGGTLQIDLGTPGQATGQFDLQSQAGRGAAVVYSGGFQGTKR